MKIKLLSLLFIGLPFFGLSQTKLDYKVDIRSPEKQYYHVTLSLSGLKEDSLILKLPNWMPGYYQNMNYFRNIDEFAVLGNSTSIKVSQPDSNTWKFTNIKSGGVTVTYRVKSSRKFVASTFLDSTHGYIIPGSMFFYVKDKLRLPVTITINTGNPQWKTVSGLTLLAGKSNQYTTNDFDILYDSPILVAPLEELSSFVSGGAEHRFIGYKMGEFDRNLFMANMKKMVDAAIAIIGDTPFKQYTFIAIGPGRGGIEHLNNTTVSFTGNGLNTKDGMNGMMNFLAHEYFHHYNVKRIRPYELGPFDYDRGSKTNLLWVSEGLSVYYEYLIVKRAGITDEQGLLQDFEGNINSVENNPGRLYQTLAESSYETWSDGPFGRQGTERNKSISYYEKGPVVGILLDFRIRYITKNKKSLDDVMRYLYWHYYKELSRGFTDAEFRQACETIAGESLNDVFQYIYSTKEMDYPTYFGYAGLAVTTESVQGGAKKKLTIRKVDNPDSLQTAIYKSWMGN